MKYGAALAFLLTIAWSGIARADAGDTGQPEQSRSHPAAIEMTLIEVMSDTGQALVRDEIRDEYVVVRVGQRLHGFRVSRITADRLELSSEANVGTRIVLAPVRQGAAELALIDPYPTGPIRSVSAPPQARAAETAIDARTRSTGQPAAAPQSGPPEAALEPAAAPQQPGPSQAVVEAPEPIVMAPEPGPADRSTAGPAASPEARPEAPAPPPPASFGAPSPNPGSQPEDPARAPAAEAEPAADPSGVDAAIEAATGRPSARRTPASAPRTGPHQDIRRRDLDAALSDFHALSRELRLRLVEGGARIEALTEGTFFHRLGLRPGDLVRRVDERPITGIGDAAVIYGRIDLARDVTVELDRGGRPLVLRYRLVD